MAISPTLLVIASLLVALAFLAWPFLSIAMPGPRRRVSRLDALQLGFSGTVGLSIATILAVTSVQCAQLESDVEHQLKDLATELDQELVAEITSSARTLDALEAWLGSCPSATKHARHPEDYPVQLSERVSPGGRGRAELHRDQRSPTDRCRLRLPELRRRGADRQARPTGQEGVAQGGQAAAGRRQRPPVLQRGIHLFAGPADAECPGRRDDSVHGPAVRASVAGVVHHRPAERGAGAGRRASGGSLPVAAITLPMRSVISPVIPHGFEFAIIDKTGRVVFHSDAQRNTFEDLFLETDRNRQLRSLVVTGVDGSVRTEYWGRPYLAHVKHAQAYGWSVVTLFDRRTLRGLMLEWTMVSLLFLGGYTVLWASAVVLAVTTGGAWLWPDRFRKRRYGVLSGFYLLLIVGFGLAFASPSLSRSTIALAGFAVPILACVVSVLVLKGRPAARVDMSRLDYQYDYCIAGALLLVVTGVLPGAAFVARSYDAHIEAYLKHRQLGVVQALTDATIDRHGTRPGVGQTGRDRNGGPPPHRVARSLPVPDIAVPRGGPCPTRRLVTASMHGTRPSPRRGSRPARKRRRHRSTRHPYGPPRSWTGRPCRREAWRRRTRRRGSWNTTCRTFRRCRSRFASWCAAAPTMAHGPANAWPSRRSCGFLRNALAASRRPGHDGPAAAGDRPPDRHRAADPARSGRPGVRCRPVHRALRVPGRGHRSDVGARTARRSRGQDRDPALRSAGHGTAHSRSGEAQPGCCAVRDRPVTGAGTSLGRGRSCSEPADGPILVTDLDTGAPGTRELADRVQLLCALVSARTRAVLVLSTQPLPELAAAIKRDPDSTPDTNAALDEALGATGDARRDRPGLARAPRRGGRPAHAVGDLRRRRLVATPDGAGATGVDGDRPRGRACASTRARGRGAASSRGARPPRPSPDQRQHPPPRRVSRESVAAEAESITSWNLANPSGVQPNTDSACH